MNWGRSRTVGVGAATVAVAVGLGLGLPGAAGAEAVKGTSAAPAAAPQYIEIGRAHV